MPLRYPNLRSPTLRDAVGRRAPQQRVLPTRGLNTPAPRAPLETMPTANALAPWETMSMGNLMDPLMQNSLYPGTEVASAQIGATSPMGNSRAMEQLMDPLAQFQAPQLGSNSAGGPPQLGSAQYGQPPYMPSWGAPGWLYGLNGMNQWGR